MPPHILSSLFGRSTAAQEQAQRVAPTSPQTQTQRLAATLLKNLGHVPPALCEHLRRESADVQRHVMAQCDDNMRAYLGMDTPPRRGKLLQSLRKWSPPSPLDLAIAATALASREDIDRVLHRLHAELERTPPNAPRTMPGYKDAVNGAFCHLLTHFKSGNLSAYAKNLVMNTVLDNMGKLPARYQSDIRSAIAAALSEGDVQQASSRPAPTGGQRVASAARAQWNAATSSGNPPASHSGNREGRWSGLEREIRSAVSALNEQVTSLREAPEAHPQGSTESGRPVMQSIARTPVSNPIFQQEHRGGRAPSAPVQRPSGEDNYPDLMSFEDQVPSSSAGNGSHVSNLTQGTPPPVQGGTPARSIGQTDVQRTAVAPSPWAPGNGVTTRYAPSGLPHGMKLIYSATRAEMEKKYEGDFETCQHQLRSTPSTHEFVTLRRNKAKAIDHVRQAMSRRILQDHAYRKGKTIVYQSTGTNALSDRLISAVPANRVQAYADFIRYSDLPKGEVVLLAGDKKFGGGIFGNGQAQEEAAVEHFGELTLLTAHERATGRRTLTRDEEYTSTDPKNCKPVLVKGCIPLIRVSDETAKLTARKGKEHPDNIFTNAHFDPKRAMPQVRNANYLHLLSTAAPKVKDHEKGKPYTPEMVADMFANFAEAVKMLDKDELAKTDAWLHVPLWGAGVFGHDPVMAMASMMAVSRVYGIKLKIYGVSDKVQYNLAQTLADEAFAKADEDRRKGRTVTLRDLSKNLQVASAAYGIRTKPSRSNAGASQVPATAPLSAPPAVRVPIPVA